MLEHMDKTGQNRCFGKIGNTIASKMAIHCGIPVTPKAKSSGSIGAGEPRRDRGFIACKHHTYLYIPCRIPEQVVTNFGFTAKGCHECTSLFLFMLKRRSLMKQFEPLPGEATEETGTCLQSELMLFGIGMA